MQFRKCTCDYDSFTAYISLSQACFPQASHLTRQYFKWLYSDNPSGEVLGFDAYDGKRLAAHYVCVPASLLYEGKQIRGLLSLNTATHPDYRGQGLFKKLAGLTYECAAEAGYELVYGVANANSTPGFVRSLGFQLVAALEASLGFGRLGVEDWSAIRQRCAFRREWTQKDLRWRLSNPSNPSFAAHLEEGVVAVHAATGRFGIQAYAEIFGQVPIERSERPKSFSPRLFLGMVPEGFRRRTKYAPIPQLFKPSPLNLIVRDLRGGGTPKLDQRSVLISYIDFDAY